jgi:hypothetical protein
MSNRQQRIRRLNQPVSALLALRIFVSVVPALLLIVSLPVARAYPITRAHLARFSGIGGKESARAAGCGGSVGLRLGLPFDLPLLY